MLVSTAQPGTAAPDKTADIAAPPATQTSTEPPVVPQKKRDEVIGKDWQKSTDVAWTTSGDANGFHVLAARAKDGYAWRTVASLSEQAFDADQWIGNACATASGKKLVVVYAPRTFTNKPDLFERGGFTAVVDLESGAVKKLPVQSTLAYYSPGCGSGERAVLSQHGTETLGKTRLLEVDAAAGTVAAPIEMPGQLTSAIPTKEGIVAADSVGLVTVDGKGARRLLAKSTSLPFNLRADDAGGVVFLDHEGTTSFVRRVERVARDAAVTTLAQGPLTELGLTASATGKVFITGKTDKVEKLPAAVVKADVPKLSTVSVQGGLAVTSVQRAKTSDPGTATPDPSDPRPVRVEAKVSSTGKATAFTVLPGGAPSAAGQAASPKLPTTSGEMTASGSPNNPVDSESPCSIARNDPNLQVYQPTPRQVEWAVNYAVTGGLFEQRPANWKQSGMPVAWKPQEMFPSIPLEGGGQVPSQVMLGILAQESNLWQAARYALPGETANPLIGNYYGVDIYNGTEGDDWDINWGKADCGYGVSQVTDGMRKAGQTKPGETALAPEKQRAVAVDFATNIAAGLRILQSKWNETRRAGLTVNNGDPKWLENWYFAIWAYNSGFNAPSGNNPWGLGWANNPANPHYPPNRAAFLENGYSDAAHPQDWSYPEKVMGWAGHPIEAVVSPGVTASGYMYTYWRGWRENIDQPVAGKPSAEQNRRNVKPPTYFFCEPAKNNCDKNVRITPNKPDDKNTPEDESTIGEPPGPCANKDAAGYYDLRCWWHYPATWKPDCDAYECGVETNRFRDPDVPYQADGISYPPNCTRAGLPAGTVVVDDSTAAPVPSAARPCGRQQTEGSFDLQFAGDAPDKYPSKIDFHQLGAGYNGHFWFSHTNGNDTIGQRLKITGTWKLNRPINGWWRVLVHTPDHGAHTQQAKYEINTGQGWNSENFRYLSQGTESNQWVSIGVYEFAGNPEVRLDNINEYEGRGVNDVAWDAIAFQPLPAKPKHVVAVLGDSYSSGEGAGDYYRESDNNHGTPDWAACRRSREAWGRKLMLPGANSSLGSLVDAKSNWAELGFVACSGAWNWNVNGDGRPASWPQNEKWHRSEGQFREISQVNSGALNKNTTLVALTIGGNDEGAFSRALTECMTPVIVGGSGACATPTILAKYKAIMDNTKTETKRTLTKIADTARNAQIVLMGYPVLLEQYSCVIGIDSAEVTMLRDLANYMTQKQKEAVTEVGLSRVHFADAIPTFDQHQACEREPWINGIKIGANGEGDFHEGDFDYEGGQDKLCIFVRINNDDQCLSREGFHPNGAGTSAYADLLKRKLTEIGYQGS